MGNIGIEKERHIHCEDDFNIMKRTSRKNMMIQCEKCKRSIMVDKAEFEQIKEYLKIKSILVEEK